jgi:2-methylcitrate dehydratase PrpD
MNTSTRQGIRFRRSGQEDSMSTLCRMASNTRYEDLPGNVVGFAKHSILDAIAVTAAGSSMEGVPNLESVGDVVNTLLVPLTPEKRGRIR